MLNGRKWRQTALFKGIQISSIVVDECQGTNSTVQCPSMCINVTGTTDSLLPCNIWLFSNDWNICGNSYVMCVHLNYLNSVSDNVALICLTNGVMSPFMWSMFDCYFWRKFHDTVLKICYVCLWKLTDRTALIPYLLAHIYDMIWYDIFVNCNWVVTWWQYTFTHKQYIEQYKTNNTYNNATILEECGPCPVLASITLAFALQLRKKHGKISVRVAASKNT